MSAKESNQRWEDFVNSYIFANFKNLERWIAKRYASEMIGDDTFIFNYIKFPKPENGRILTVELLKYMIQSIEADDSICENIFGPAYEKGTAEIVINGNADISIIWNRKSYVNDLLDIDDEGEFRTYIHELYNWDVFLGTPKNLSKDEIIRREKIDNELRRLSKALNDPNLLPENKTAKDLEYIYNHYNWDEILKNN